MQTLIQITAWIRTEWRKYIFDDGCYNGDLAALNIVASQCRLASIWFQTLFNSLWPSDAIWRHRTGSTLAQVMACCLTAPSHYLNQCWLIISKVQSYSSGSHFTKDTPAIHHWNQFENYLSKFPFKSPRGQWVNWINSYPGNRFSGMYPLPAYA